MRFGRRSKRKRRSPLGQRRKRMFRLKMVLLVFVVVIIIGIFWWLLRLPEVVVSEIRIHGNTITKTEEIQAIAEDRLSGTYFYFVPKNSEFFLPKQKIKKDIESAFPRVKETSVSFRFGEVLVIDIEERKPHALWCGPWYLNTEEEFGHCYFLDEKSFVYAKAPDFTGHIFFTYFGVLEGATAPSTPIGHAYMNETDFGSIEVFLDAFEEIGYIPVSFTKLDGEDVSVRMKSGAEVRYGRDMRLSVVLDNLQSAVESEAFQDILQQDIEYIDLRFGSKVYYKLRGEEAVER